MKRYPKMDRKLISQEPWEITRIRTMFYITPDDELIEHPTKAFIQELLIKFNNSRRKVYKALQEAHYYRA